ncbi:DUF1735 domain-containing protein [Niabella pedocola]|uniref:DUF1735 domain-containing protein n=1 Tax=Niabella pedocola TaxID=1752077 RepID=A0ABS8PNF9_9BACT|nr:DUF1735 domain-containing protein [Niabella pedocola]MCD2421808.1 DUF1735 domain-containing protein [Niabella pedocola]
MKLAFLNRWGILTGMALLVVSFSCKKNENGIQNNELFVYAPTGSIAYNAIGVDSLVVLETGTTKNDGIAFPVNITRPVDRAIQVATVIEPSLVRWYDSVNNNLTAPSPEITPGSVELANGGMVHIEAGATQSYDSVRIIIKDPSLFAGGNLTYVIPVVISSTTNGVPISNNRKVMFVTLYSRVMSAGISTFSNTTVINDSIAKNGNDIAGNNLFYLRGLVTEPVSGQQTVQAEINNALIPAYNGLNKTSYLPFPAAVVQLQKATAVIPAGSVSDSLAVRLDNLGSLEAGKQYQVPLQVKGVSGTPPLPVAYNRKVVYLNIKVYASNLDPRYTGLTGTAVTRSGWSASASATYSTNVAPRTIDNSTSTNWLATVASLPASLDLNLGAVKTIKGFNVNPPTTSSYNFLTMQIYSSQDGVSWNLEGTFNATASSTAVKVFKFVTPVTAQYFRFNITRASGTSYTGIAEVNAIE